MFTVVVDNTQLILVKVFPPYVNCLEVVPSIHKIITKTVNYLTANNDRYDP